MVTKEALRLFPPTPFLLRINLSDISICNKIVPAGTLLFMSPYVLHHDPRNYENPEEFRPERWTSDFYKSKTQNFTYLPFGAGRRICVGQKFAIQEAKIALATIFREFSVKLVPKPAVESAVMIILRPKNGVKVKLEQITK